MLKSSFTILKSAYPELYQLAVEAEKYAHSDHPAFLLILSSDGLKLSEIAKLESAVAQGLVLLISIFCEG